LAPHHQSLIGRHIPLDRRVVDTAKCCSKASLAGPEQPRQVLGPDHLDGLLGELWRSHAVHRAGHQVALGHCPLEEGVQAPVAVVGGGRLPAGQLVGDERLEMVTLELAGE
jgi:hypothetical protein